MTPAKVVAEWRETILFLRSRELAKLREVAESARKGAKAAERRRQTEAPERLQKNKAQALAELEQSFDAQRREVASSYPRWSTARRKALGEISRRERSAREQLLWEEIKTRRSPLEIEVELTAPEFLPLLPFLVTSVSSRSDLSPAEQFFELCLFRVAGFDQLYSPPVRPLVADGFELWSRRVDRLEAAITRELSDGPRLSSQLKRRMRKLGLSPEWFAERLTDSSCPAANNI